MRRLEKLHRSMRWNMMMQLALVFEWAANWCHRTQVEAYMADMSDRDRLGF